MSTRDICATFKELYDADVSYSMRFVPWKDYKPVTVDLKRIYQAPTEEQAVMQLAAFAETCDDDYPLA